MIEKFTKEELEIIMKEIKELPKDNEKRKSCEAPLKRMKNAYLNNELSGVPHPYELANALLFLCDCFTGNFTKVKAPQSKKYKGDYIRYNYIRKDIFDDYLSMANGIVDVIEKYSRKYEEE